MADDPERLLLEQRIHDDPDDVGAWAVYADYLQMRGDPWGERLILGLAQRNQDDALRATLRDYDRRMAPALLGEALAALLEQPGFAATIELERRYGLVLGARIGRRWIAGRSADYEVDRRHATQVLAALLAGGAARLLRSLLLGDCDRESILTTLQAAGPRGPLRRLGLGWELRNDGGDVVGLPALGDLGEFLALAPKLRQLELCGVAEGLEHPRIEQLSLEVGGEALCSALLDPLRQARLPSLRGLTLRLQPVGAAARRASHRSFPPPPPDLSALFRSLSDNPTLRSLETLELHASRQLRSALAVLIDAPLLSQLRRVSAVDCSIDDSVLEFVSANVGAFAGLERLVLPTGMTGKQARRGLKRQLANLSFVEP